MKRINQEDRKWEPGSHEDPNNPGVLKRVIVKHEEVDPVSKLMMVNLCKIPIGKTHVAHSHKTMEEVFYFTEGEGVIRIDDQFEPVGPGDRVIVPARSVHQVKNTSKVDLKYIGLGIALD